MNYSFGAVFTDRRKKYSALCVGIDPSVQLLKEWGLTVDPSGLRRFVDVILDAVGDSVAVVKPQSAFFEQFGPQGLSELQRLCATFTSKGVLVIIDCKRSDIGHSMEAYARTYLGPDRAYDAAAITLNAYMGFETLKPATDAAAASGQAVFVVVSSSNPEGLLLQSARTNGVPITEMLAGAIVAENRALVRQNGSKIGHCGAVCGFSHDRSPRALLEKLPEAPILVPGLGAQGGTCKAYIKEFDGYLERSIPSVGRSILAAGPEKVRIVEALEHFRSGLEPTRGA